MFRRIAEIIIVAVGTFMMIASRLPFFESLFNSIFQDHTLEAKQIFSFVFGASIITIYVPIQNEILRRQNKKYKEFIKENVDSIRHVYSNILCQKFDNNDFKEVSFRVFIPKKNIGYLFKKLGGKVIFKHIPIDGLYSDKDPIKEKLEFVVAPESKSQALVGMSYCRRGIGIISNNDKEDEVYQEFVKRMDDFQKEISSEHKFVMTVPIIVSKNRIIAIITADSQKSISITKRSKSEILALKKFGRDFYTRIQPILKN